MQNKFQYEKVKDSGSIDKDRDATSGVGETLLFLIAFVGITEMGFFYTTVFTYCLMTVAFMEMKKMQAREDKEQHI
jgi:hypothetical protein